MSAEDTSAVSQRTKDVLTDSGVNFNALLLSNSIVQGLNNYGYFKPSPIQYKAIPLGKCGFDLIVKAKSGTGKTAVFGIVALEMVNVSKNKPQVLILAPTREIAVQIQDVISSIGSKIKGLKVEVFIGGLPIEDDIKKIQSCHIVVGAPGRVKHLLDKGYLKTDNIKLFILDEADKLMEASFQADINQIYNKLSPRKQMIAASATYPDELDQFLSLYMQSATHVSPDTGTPLLLGLRQFVFVLKSHLNMMQQIKIKNAGLIKVLSTISFTQCLVFSNYQLQAESISNYLNQEGWSSLFISAAQSQPQRLKVVHNLKQLKCRILISTDLTARGIDASNVDLVINYDVPHDAATYLHRMGRAGRYGTKGICVSLAAQGQELVALQNILGLIGGTDLSIAKLPADGICSDDIWNLDLTLFDHISGTLSEKNDNNKLNLKNSVLEIKYVKNDRKSTKRNKNQPENITEVSELNDNEINDNENIKDETQNDETNSNILSGIDANLLLQSLQDGNTIDNPNSFLNSHNETEMEDQKLKKRKRISCTTQQNNDSPSTSCSTELVKQLHVEPKTSNKNKNHIFEKNLALFGLTKLLTEDFSSAVKVEDNIVSSVDTYLKRVREEKDLNLNSIKRIHSNDKMLEVVSEISEHVEQSKENNRYAETVSAFEETDPTIALQSVFKFGYDYIIGKSNIHWLDSLNDRDYFEKLNDSQEIDSENSNSENLLNDDDESEEIDNNISGENNVDTSMTNYHDRNVQQNFNYCEKEDCSNERFTSYYDHYGNMLENHALTFEDVHTFDDWFTNWQTQVQSVRDFIQQNVYLQEMNKFNHYKT